jgi:hypothetical protein
MSVQQEKRRFDVLTTAEYVQDKQIKTYWTKVGSAFENADGSFNLSLRALPLTDPKTGTAKLHMRLPLPPRDGAKPANSASAGAAGGAVDTFPSGDAESYGENYEEDL